MKANSRRIIVTFLAILFFSINVKDLRAQCCIEINGFTITPDPGVSGSLVNFIIQATTVDSSEKTSKKDWTFDTANKYILVNFCFKAKSFPLQTTHIDTVRIPANLLRAVGTYTVYTATNLSNDDCWTVGSNDTIIRTYKVFPVGLHKSFYLNSARVFYDHTTDLLIFNDFSPRSSVRILSIEGAEVIAYKDWQGEPISFRGISAGCYLVEIVSFGRKTFRRVIKS